MPKGSHSKGSDDDFDFKRREDFNFDLELKGTTGFTQARKIVRLISTNVEILIAVNSIIPILHFTITARNRMEDSFLKTQCIMARISKGLLKIVADQG